MHDVVTEVGLTEISFHRKDKLSTVVNLLVLVESITNYQ